MNEDKKLNGFNNGRDTTEGVGGQEPFWGGDLSQPKLKAVKTAESVEEIIKKVLVEQGNPIEKVVSVSLSHYTYDLETVNKIAVRYANQFSQPKEGEDDCLKIVNDLSEWSKKYPRGRIYNLSNNTMDAELIAIEERAKSLTEKQKP